MYGKQVGGWIEALHIEMTYMQHNIEMTYMQGQQSSLEPN